MSIPKSLKIAAAFLLVFAAGIAAGAFGTAYKFKRAFEEGIRGERWKEYAMNGLTRQLDLTPAQQEKVRPLLDEAGVGYKGAFGRMFQEGGQVLADFNRKLDTLLTPEQATKRRERSREFREHVKQNLNLDLPPE